MWLHDGGGAPEPAAVILALDFLKLRKVITGPAASGPPSTLLTETSYQAPTSNTYAVCRT
jgi:hypothetical protein